MIARGDIWDTDLGRHGVRPALVVTRSIAIPVLNALSLVMISKSLRGHAAEVELDERHGLDGLCAANCDVIANVEKSSLLRHRGTLDPATLRRLDDALRIALDL